MFKVKNWTDLENVRSLVVESCDQESDTVGTTVVALGSELHVAAQVGDHLGEPERRVVSVSGGQTFRPHPTTQTLSVGSQTGERDADVIVLKLNFFLIFLKQQTSL